jgi:flagellar basal-body rod protein FlgG
MQAQQQKLDAVANDLANSDTTGYKAVRVGFKDLLYEQSGRPSAAGVQTGAGAAAVDGGRSFSTQGSLQSTGLPLDVAIQGQGFIKVKLADGRQALTRDGNLHVDGNRRLVTSTGAFVQPSITVPVGVSEDQMGIGPDGTVRANGAVIGKIGLGTVPSLQGLQSTGDNAFVATAASGAVRAAPTATVLTSGALEGSNVDSATALTDLMDAQRTYSLVSKAISTADQMMEIANQVKR